MTNNSRKDKAPEHNKRQPVQDATNPDQERIDAIRRQQEEDVRRMREQRDAAVDKGDKAE